MYFKLTAEVNVQVGENFKAKKLSFLTDANSYTEAETRLYQIAEENKWQNSWNVHQISKANYDRVIPLKAPNEDEPEPFYNIKYSLDLGTGDKPLKPELCVQAANDEAARQIGLKVYAEYDPATIEFLTMAITDIVEYVDYNPSHHSEEE